MSDDDIEKIMNMETIYNIDLGEWLEMVVAKVREWRSKL